jgi:hypothetical protein
MDDKEGYISDNMHIVSGEIEFYFGIYNKAFENYRQFIDYYLYKLFKLILANAYAVDNTLKLTLIEIQNLKAVNLNVTDDSGEFLTPKIDFTFKVLQQ